jgi:RimJ/RimL family protein N-acetyltransferase
MPAGVDSQQLEGKFLKIEPCILEGRHVRLEPLTVHHCGRLFEIGCVEQVWRYLTDRFETESDMRAFIETALQSQSQGAALPFATIEKTSGLAVGSTRFANIVPEHKRVEIGWTWIAPAWQRSAVNTEAKYLMLRHAFEVWRCGRVELKTNARNERSRQAILRIGAKEEGTLRNHMINPDGSFRDTVYFSIIESEWPEVRKSLEEKLARGNS